MTLLPIVERELRVQARRRSTYWFRGATALAAMGLSAVIILSGSARSSPHEIARVLFVAQSILAFVFCLFAGVFLTADCLSFEKREGTLGLLFLTDLKGHDLVLGKLTASSLVSLYALAATFPVMAIPLLMGGVTGAEFSRIVLVLLATLFLSLSIGLAVSAVCRDARIALIGTLGIMAGLTGLGPALLWLYAVFVNSNVSPAVWLLGSPTAALIQAFQGNYRPGMGIGAFRLSASLTLAMALAALAMASVWMHRHWREREEAGPAPFWRTRWRRMRWGPANTRVGMRGFQDSSPFAWLVARDRLARLLAWGVIGLLGVLWLCFLLGALSGRRSLNESCSLFAMAVAFLLHTAFKVVVALEVGRRFGEDKRSGAMELVLSTPLSPKAIVSGHWEAMRQHFRGPILALLGINAVMFVLIVVMNLARMPYTGRLFCGVALGLGAVVLISDFVALNWVGMLLGLRSRSQPRAVLNTLCRILLPPWLGVVLFFLIVVLGRPSIRDNDLPGYAFVWFLLGFFLSLAHVTWARLELHNHFRELVNGDRALIRSASARFQSPAT